MAPRIRTVAVMAPGDMGHAVGALLRRNGLRVVTCLEGRSRRTRELAASAGIQDLPDERTLVREADALLSILVPARALDLAARIGAAVRATGADLVYVDCNAIAPQTVHEIAKVIADSGARFVDAGIIGPPPVATTSPRFYASGPHAAAFTELRDNGLDVRVVGDQPGQASALKMCYAALTKGTCSIMTQLSVVAARLGVSDALQRELAFSQPHHLEWMRRWVVTMVPKAHRWVGEMEEIARTFEDSGMTPASFNGAAATYEFVADTPAGQTSPEEWARADRTYEQVVAELATAWVHSQAAD